MQRIPLSPILCLLVLTASAYGDPALVKKVEPSVVFIKTDKSLGSGFIVSEDKVVTNYHVIRGASKVDITFSGEDSPTFTQSKTVSLSMTLVSQSRTGIPSFIPVGSNTPQTSI